jgi:protein-tyrosine phosphatase
MPTEVLRLDPQRDYRAEITRAANLLRDGGLVGFPTETVYGVGARADLPAAIAALREVKGRAETKPFTLHIGRPDDVHQYVPDLTALARRFIRKAWPGPVTLVFSVDDPASTPAVKQFGSSLVERLYFERTLGVRCPDDPIATALLTEAAVPVVAASANRAGNPPPRSAEGVLAELDGAIPLLLDGGWSRYAKPSTVVRLDASGYHVLREGVVDERTLKRYGSLTILFVCSGNTCRSPMAAALCRRLLSDRLGCKPEELERFGVRVTSAGAHGFGGGPASAGAIEALARRGFDLSSHTARALDVDSVQHADHIFGMTHAHVEAVAALVPGAADKTRLLAEDEDINDPYGGPTSAYEECAKRLEAALERRLAEIPL